MLFVAPIIAIVILAVIVGVVMLLAGAGSVREGPDPSEGSKSTG